MTADQILVVISQYEKDIYASPWRYAADRKWPTDNDADAHVKWMCNEVKQMVAENRLEKAFRWLGFIQGVIWVTGVYSINQLKDHNKPNDKS